MSDRSPIDMPKRLFRRGAGFAVRVVNKVVKTVQLLRWRRLRTEHEYATRDGTPLTIDLYRPDTGGPHPVIVWMHGGGWCLGSRRNVEPGFMRQIDRGYVVASVQYSLSGSAVWPAQIHDVKAAVRWLRANAERFDLDDGAFVACGDSAGGHLACVLGATSGTGELDGELGVTGVASDVQGVVAWFAPVDLNTMGATTQFDHMGSDSFSSHLLGVPVGEHPDLARMAGPIPYLTPSAPPFYLSHGTDDEVVSVGQSEQLEAALRGCGIEVHAVYPPGLGHSDRRFNAPDLMSGVESFLDAVVTMT